MRALAASALALLALVACRVDVPTFQADDVDDDAAATDAPDTDATETDAPPNDGVIVDGPPLDADGLTELIGRDWTVGAGEDVLKCRRVLVPPSGLYLTELRAVDAPGTHHTILALSDDGATGDFDCSLMDVGANYKILFSSDGNGRSYTFPTGVGLGIPGGEYLTFVIHVRNTTASPLTGRTSLRTRLTESNQVEHAGLLAAGDVVFTVPAQSANVVTTGTCNVGDTMHLLAFAPHMHRFGTNMRVTITRAGTPTDVHDAAYDVSEQRSISITPVTINSGDSITVRCTYNNTSVNTVMFGQSFLDEQCFATFLMYPRTGGGSTVCAN